MRGEGRTRRAYSSALVLVSAVLPFLGLALGSAPIPRPRPRHCSHFAFGGGGPPRFLGGTPPGFLRVSFVGTFLAYC
jgi:hypothetical protein